MAVVSPTLGLRQRHDLDFVYCRVCPVLACLKLLEGLGQDIRTDACSFGEEWGVGEQWEEDLARSLT